MARILLSQSQVSVVLTTGLIALLTILLFFTGYIHQQRTVVGLQAALKPKVPKPPPSPAAQNGGQAVPLIPPSRILGSRGKADGEEGGHVAYTDFSASKDNVDWSRLAHIQLVRRHHDMCSAIMVLAELHRLKSPARRILLFPQPWLVGSKAGKGDIKDPFLDISRRLMKVAARRYGVELRPINPWYKSVGGLEEEHAQAYSLASAFALTDLDRVMTIETPGLVVDAEPLDAVLAFTETAPLAMLHDTSDRDGLHDNDLFLLQPSKAVHKELKEAFAGQNGLNDTTLPTLFPDTLRLDTKPTNLTLIRSIGALHDPPETAQGADPVFNATAFLTNVSYIRFSDPKLPGPEYDVPWPDKVAARPKNKHADWVWTKLYGEFEQQRMEICGLGLEAWRP